MTTDTDLPLFCNDLGRLESCVFATVRVFCAYVSAVEMLHKRSGSIETFLKFQRAKTQGR